MSSIIGYENILDKGTTTASTEATGSGIITYAGANAHDNNTSDQWKPTAVPAYLTNDGGVRPKGMWLSDIVDGTTDQTSNANDLTENGTVTISDAGINTGLQAFSAYSTSNFYSRAYDADFDYDTGSLFIMGWIKKTASGSFETIVSRGFYSGAYVGALFQVYTVSAGNLAFYITDDGGATSDFVLSDESIDGNGWTHFYAARNGTVLELYLNAIKAADDVTIVNAGSLNNASADIRIGLNQAGSQAAANSSLALVRTGASSLSSSEILNIYNEEKHFFEDNAAAPTNYLASWMPTADYFAIAAHDGYTQNATFKLQYSDDNSAWTDASATISPDEDGVKYDTFTQSSHDYWRVVIDGNIASLGYVCFGRGMTLPQGMPIGYGVIHDSDDASVINAVSENGSLIGRSIISTGKSGSIQINNMSADYQRMNWPRLKAYIRTKPFLFIWDDTKDEAVLCWLQGNVPTPTYSDVTRMTATLQVEGL